jgi:hypothetical protein
MNAAIEPTADDLRAAGRNLVRWTLSAGGHGLFARARKQVSDKGGRHCIYVRLPLDPVLDGRFDTLGHEIALAIEQTAWQILERTARTKHTKTALFDESRIASELRHAWGPTVPALILPPVSGGHILTARGMAERHATDIVKVWREGDLYTFRPFPLTPDAPRVPVVGSMALHQIEGAHAVILRRPPLCRTIAEPTLLRRGGMLITDDANTFGLVVAPGSTENGCITFLALVVWEWDTARDDVIIVRK